MRDLHGPVHLRSQPQVGGDCPGAHTTAAVTMGSRHNSGESNKPRLELLPPAVFTDQSEPGTQYATGFSQASTIPQRVEEVTAHWNEARVQMDGLQMGADNTSLADTGDTTSVSGPQDPEVIPEVVIPASTPQDVVAIGQGDLLVRENGIQINVTNYITSEPRPRVFLETQDEDTVSDCSFSFPSDAASATTRDPESAAETDPKQYASPAMATRPAMPRCGLQDNPWDSCHIPLQETTPST